MNSMPGADAAVVAAGAGVRVGEGDGAVAAGAGPVGGGVGVAFVGVGTADERAVGGAVVPRMGMQADEQQQHGQDRHADSVNAAAPAGAHPLVTNEAQSFISGGKR